MSLSAVRLPHRTATPARTRGFTLLELMVVVVLIGVILGMSTLYIARDADTLVEEEARRLQALLRMANEESVMNNRELALQLHRDGYQFLGYDRGSGTWAPFEGRSPFRPRCLPDLVAMEVQLGGEGDTILDRMGCIEGKVRFSDDQENDPDRVYHRVLFLSSGEMTPFRISLPVSDDADGFLILGNLQGQVQLYYPGEYDGPL